MPDESQHINEPLVSVILPTFNRPAYLAQALGSIVRQSYQNLQIIVVNDGGCDVSSEVASFNDPRIVFINRKVNRGKPASLNEAISRATGKYIAYLDDDDLFYAHHIATLVDALEGDSSYGVAYSDLYKVYCRLAPDGSRTVLSKVVEVSRDFDRFLTLYFNQVFHVSCMHRRDLLDKTGPYNENLNVLIDWDMTRRLAFFTDFLHITEITGEFYQPVGDNERISFKQRLDKHEYTSNAITIRTTRPAKPWPKIADLSLILLTDKLDRQTAAALGLIWRWTFYPYKLYLSLTSEDIALFNTDMPNVVTVAVETNATQLQRIDRAIAECEGQYVAVVPAGFAVRDMWVEDSLYALLRTSNDGEAFELEDSTPDCRAVVAKKEHIQLTCSRYPQLSIQEGLTACGINVRRLRSDEIPFQFDSLLNEARKEQNRGNYKHAAKIYSLIGDRYDNQLWMKSQEACALFNAGEFGRTAEVASWINSHRPTVETLLLEAKLKRKAGDFNAAIKLLSEAEEILSGEGMANDRRQKTEDRRQRTEDRGLPRVIGGAAQFNSAL